MREHKKFKKNSVYTFIMKKGRKSINKLCVLSDKDHACLVDISGVNKKNDEVGYKIDEQTAILLKKKISDNTGVTAYYYGWVSGDGEEYIDASTE